MYAKEDRTIDFELKTFMYTTITSNPTIRRTFLQLVRA